MVEARPAQTAPGPAALVAVDQYERHPVLVDEVARRLLPAGVRLLVPLARWGPVRRALINATERRVPGLWALFLCRKRYIEEKLAAALEGGLDAVVVLGAGFDTLAYRVPELASIPVWELDLPENIDRKRARLEKVYGRVPDHVTLAPVDFETRRLGDALTAAGHTGRMTTFFVWEAVTMYLTEEAVRATLADLAAAAPAGSRLVFTYIRQDFLDGTAFYGAEALYRQYRVKAGLWRFGLRPDRVADFLAEYRWRAVEQPEPREFVTRYIRPTGRDLTLSEIERSVYAEKT
jgi:methyltransferase (TIGR00027 family)